MARSLVAEQAYYLSAPTARVFRALTQPGVLVTWFLSDAKLEPKKGGAFSFDWIGGYHMESTLTRYDPNKAVGFRWVDRLADGRLAKTNVLFRIEKKGKGTLLSLEHSGFTVPEHYAECSSRWAYYLTNLKSVLDHGTDLRSPSDW